MIINGYALITACPIKDMLTTKERLNGVSHGLAEVGYDIRIKQAVLFGKDASGARHTVVSQLGSPVGTKRPGIFALASSIEEFQMPSNMAGIVHDKSTWARRGLSVFNTVIEPGWDGFLTLELVYHGQETLFIPAGSGIAQVIFHKTVCSASYTGKYQNQVDEPVPAIAG